MAETQFKSVDAGRGEPVTRTILDQTQSNLNYLKEEVVRPRYSHDWYDYTNLKYLSKTTVNQGLMVMSGMVKIPNSFQESVGKQSVAVKFPVGFDPTIPPLVTTGLVANIPNGDGVVNVAMTKTSSSGFTLDIVVFSTWSSRKKTVTSKNSSGKKVTKTLQDMVPDGMLVSWIAIGKAK